MVGEPVRYAYDVADAVNCSVQRSTSTRRDDRPPRGHRDDRPPRRQRSSPAAARDRHERLVECLKRVPSELLGAVVGAPSLRPPATSAGGAAGGRRGGRVAGGRRAGSTSNAGRSS